MNYRLGKEQIKDAMVAELERAPQIVSNLIELLPENAKMTRQTTSKYLKELMTEDRVTYIEVLAIKGRSVKLWKKKQRLE